MAFEIIVVIVFINAMATIALWQAAARKPEKLKKKFFNALLHSDPIVPKHRPPKAIGEGFESLVREGHQKFFEDFEDFADVVNWWFADEYVGTRWRLQELPDTILKHDMSDMPNFGRRYEVFYNQVRVGTLEVSPDLLAKKRSVYTNIQLEWVRLLSVYIIRELLGGIALHVCEADPTTKEYAKARQSSILR